MEHIYPSPCTMPTAPATLIRRLNAAGFEAYAVGGCVRDALLGLTPTDWDITTSALPHETATVFADHHVIETGLQHGTITVRFEQQNYEITTYRVDGGYTDSRHPDRVTFTPSVAEDVKRRDFTVNAMVWHPDSGIHDFVGGMEDLKNNVLRCVGEPERRFSEDALRILRALRFCAAYGFTAAPETKAAANALAENLCMISVERIRAELFKLLCGKDAADVLSSYPAVWKAILPDVSFSAEMLRSLPLLPPQPVYRLAALLQNAPAEDILRRLKADAATIRQVTSLIGAAAISPTTDTIVLKKLLHLYSLEPLQQAVTFRTAQAKAAGCATDGWDAMGHALEALLATDPCYSLEKLQISGKELLALGFKGKQIGEILEQLLIAVIEKRCENRTMDLIALARTMKNTP